MKKDFDKLQLTNLGSPRFVRPATGMVNFMAWLHDGRLNWEEIFEEGQADNYRAAMQFIRENCGNGKTAPLTTNDYAVLEVLFTADRTMKDIEDILGMSANQVHALIGKGMKNGFAYTYKNKGTTYAALTAFGREFYVEEFLSWK